jgi:hypothetical protein
VLPLTRPLARTVLLRWLSRRVVATVTGPRPAGPPTRQRPGPDSVVQGEVVD